VPTEELSAEHIASVAAEWLEQHAACQLRSVINATGILLHTNLGRAPMAEPAALAAANAARGYVNLEMDLITGQRSSRQDLVRKWLCRLTGAAAATVVNNNAAATLLVLRALAANREVIVSRGQLVEIGGSFRLPEIMAVSGAHLREVGTTNITRLSDYASAIGERTAALLRVHHSNYQIVGHHQAPDVEELAELARQRHVLLIDDIGSGALFDLEPWGLQGEPVVSRSLAAGADVVLFSGDKLLGGPQAGIILGRADLIQRIEVDPLMRTVRLDKMVLAALEATLRLCLDPQRAWREVPLLRMISLPAEELHKRAENLIRGLQDLPNLSLQVRADHSYVGGGTTPNQPLPSWVAVVRSAVLSSTELARRLRLGQPAVVARIHDDSVLFDLRAVLPEQDDALVQAIRAALPS
jgi:L-seryl-tRNA(Ser) seleniumtransferase